MSLRYILGKPGAGKTTLCLSEIAEKQNLHGEKNYIYIVPEQFSLQSEKSLIRATKGRGLMKAQVLSFQRLSYYIFAETGGVSKKIIEDTGKNMLLRKALFEVGDGLVYFKGSADKAGFIDKLSTMITEFYQYGVKPAELLRAAEIEASKSLRLKMQDLYLIFSSYIAYMENNYISGDETLDILADRMKASAFLTNSEVWIDGFKSFTPQENKVIESLLHMAGRVSITLTLDNPQLEFDHVAVYDAFYETKITAKRLNSIALQSGIAQEPLIFLGEPLRYQKAPELAYLRENYLRFDNAEYEGSCKNIKIFLADHIYSEIHCAAKTIMKLIRDRKYKYNEIGVVCSNLESYDKNIKAIFKQYDIPVFIDNKKDILSHPLSELVRSSLNIISSDWQYESVFRLLKTGMTGISRENIDILENYVLAYGIKRKKWRSEWEFGFEARYESFNKDELNLLRRQILAIMEPLSSHMQPRKKYKARDICGFIYLFLEKNGVTAVLERWIDEMRRCGNNEALREHSQIWGKIMQMLDKTVEILGDEEFTASEFSKILEAGLAGTGMGLAPPSLDQLLVGDMRRSRLPEIKALIVLGANEGMLPSRMKDSGLLNDEDRKMISAGNIFALAPDSVAKIYEEQFLIYTSFAKPSEYLSISCHLGGLDGKAVPPSTVLEKIKQIMPRVEMLELSTIPADSIANISAAIPTFNDITGILRKYAEQGSIPSVYMDAYAYFLQDGEYRDRLKKIEHLINEMKDDGTLSAASVDQLYGRQIKASVSKLERYVECPFSYFVQYNLRALERKVYEVEAVDLGNIFHSVLEKFARQMKANNLPWDIYDEKSIYQIAEKCVAETVNEKGNEILQSSGKYMYFAERVKKISTASILALSEHMKRGKFDIAFTETAFADPQGGGGDSLGFIDVPLDDGRLMQLEGRIDRVDTMELDGGEYIKIIDYKSGSKSFSFAEVYYGLQLQLLIYLGAFIQKWEERMGAKYAGKIFPAAVFYFKLINPIVDFNSRFIGEGSEEIVKREILKLFKMSGVVLEERDIIFNLDAQLEQDSDVIPVNLKKNQQGEALDMKKSSVVISREGFGRLMSYTMDKARKIGNEIVEGKIPVSPYQYKKNTGCAFCSFKPICKFDAAANPEGYRKMQAITDGEAINEIAAHEKK